MNLYGSPTTYPEEDRSVRMDLDDMDTGDAFFVSRPHVEDGHSLDTELVGPICFSKLLGSRSSRTITKPQATSRISMALRNWAGKTITTLVLNQ